MKLALITLFSAIAYFSTGQSFELMPGTERVFIDAQYLKFLDNNNVTSLFSRARATAEYSEQATDLFTGAYLNYTTESGLGATVLGRISSSNAGIDAGLHFFKAKKSFMIYALPSINLNNELLYSWFSIIRITPRLSENWSVYTNLELFSAFDNEGHLSSTQRIRLGLSNREFQYGVAININNNRFSKADFNPGLFIRKQF